MRVFFALVAFVALAAAHHGGPHVVPDLFEGQTEYVYDYRSLVASGLPIQSQRYAGLEKFGVLTVQVQEQQGSAKTLGLRLSHMMSGHFDQDVEDIENRRIEGISHSVVESIEKYGPVFVKIQDNEIQKLKAPEQMPEEIINIYRGIAAIFTVGKPESFEGEQHPFMNQEVREGTNGMSPVVYRRQEQGIAGNFETTYEILSNPEQYNNQLNITKTRNMLKNIGLDGRFVQSGHDARGCQNVCPTHKPEQFDKNMEPELSGWVKPSAEGCPVNFHPKTDLVEAFQTYNYNMTIKREGKVALIEQAQALDKKTLPIRKQQIKTVSLIKLHLVEERSVSQIWEQKQTTKQYEDITYRFPEGSKIGMEYLSLFNKAQNGEMLKDQIIPMIKALAQVIVSDDIELKGQTGDKVVQLTMALGALHKQELQALWTVFGETATGKSVTDLEQVQRKVLIDTIALSGSNNATEYLLDLIKGQKLSTLEAVHTLESFQKNLAQPSVRVMQQLLAVITDAQIQGQRPVLAAASIAFAEIVRGNSRLGSQQWKSQNGFVLSEQEYKQFVGIIRQQLHSAKDFGTQTIFMQTLGRLAHTDAIKALIPYVYGEPEIISQVEQIKKDQGESTKEYVDFLRQVAIYSLHHSAQLHGAAIQPIVQGIYFDKQQGYELRIAALSVMIAGQPSEAIFGRIVNELPVEENLEVASYAYSALHALANSTLPCMQQSARRVRNVLGGLPEESYGSIYSKWGTKTFWSQQANLGLKAQWDLVQSNVSFVPRAFYGGLSANKGPFVSTVGDFGFISKGLGNLQQYVLQKGGMTKIVENVMQRIRRDARTLGGHEAVQQIVQQLEETMQFNLQGINEQPRAIVFGNILGNEAFLPLDKEYVTKVAQQAGEQIVELIRGQGTEKTFRFVRVLMPRTYIQVAPAVNGLPVILSNRHPIVVSLSLKDIQTRFGSGKGQMKLNPFTVGFTGLIQPTIYHNSVHTAYTINPLEATRVAHGVRATEQTTATLPFDFSVQYTQQTGTFGFTLRPRFEKVFYHKTRAVTFKTEALLIRGVETPLLDRYTVIKTQQKPFVYDTTLGEKLGFALRVQGMSMNEQYDVNFLRNYDSLNKNVMKSLIQEISNEWFVPRTWSLRFEQNKQWSAQEIKMVVRLDNLLHNRMQKANGLQQQKQRQLSQDELTHEQVYPESLRMIAYEQEFEKLTGRKPQTEQLEQAIERMVQKTEKYWSQVDRELQQHLNAENAQARSLEYVISAKGEKKNLAVTGKIVLASTLNKQVKLAEIKMNVEKTPVSFEAQAVAAYTQAPQPFETEVREQEQRGLIGFTADLETRQTGKQQYSGKIEMTKSEEQKKQMKGLNKEKKPWFHHQCEEDKKQQRGEISAACAIARFEKSTLNHLRFEVELPQQIHERLSNASHQIRETLKAHFYRNLRSEEMTMNGDENKLQGEVIMSGHGIGMKVADLTIRTPDQEELRFERISIPAAFQPSTIYSFKQCAKMSLKQGAPEPYCVYNGHNLRSFDNVTVSLKEMKEGEKYIIARDNNEQSKFTILAEKKQGGEKTELEIVLRDSTLVKLTPPTHESTYQVRINSSEIQVHGKKAEVYQYGRQGGNMITLHVEEHKEGQNTLVVKVRDQRMRIVYDGKNVKVEIAKAQLKGHLTGICGDMNRQHVQEFTGPEGCNFEREGDFVRSFGLNGQRHHGMEGKWSCAQGVHPRAATQQEIAEHQERHTYAYQKKQKAQQQRHYQLREQGEITEETKMITLNGKICFSLEPVQTCEQGYRQVDSVMQTVAFTCLNQEHPRAMQFQRELQTQKVISHLPSHSGRSSSLVHREVESAVRCSQ